MKIDDRIKELIAVGASVTANCLSCLEYHVGKAFENRADRQEITLAIAVGKTLRRGAAAKIDKLASSLLESVSSPARAADQGCGCPS